MRRVLLSAMALTGLALASQFATAGAVRAQPVVSSASYVAGGHDLIQPVQYYNDWRWRRHEYWRWRRHEYWRHRHWEHYHHW